MGEYTGAKCPVCEKIFGPGDDVVVCPVCGTPYHRGCYQQAGRCVNEDLHERGETWTQADQQRQEERRYDASASLRCSKCGTVNPPEGIFCQVCGTRLDNAGEGDAGAGPIPDPIPLNAFTTPYGGVSPDERLDGVPVRDIALFVGANSHYFIPRFADQIEKGRSSPWNWPAFLFRGFYFLFRKMYLAGALLLLLNILLGLPATLVNLGYVFGRAAMFGFSLTALTRAAVLCNALSLALSLGCAIFANRVYCGHVLRTIRRLRPRFDPADDQDYVVELAKKGRTNQWLIVAILCGAFLLSMISGFLLAMTVV